MKSMVVLLIAIFAAGCEKSDQAKRLHGPNGMTLIVEGEKLGNDFFPDSIFIEDELGKEHYFNPKDAVSVQQSGFYYPEMWSPDNRWLVLPNGRFEGFCVFKSDKLPLAISNPESENEVAVIGASDTRWSHEFVGWKSESVFQFRAGLSGTLYDFECDLENELITSPETDVFRVVGGTQK